MISGAISLQNYIDALRLHRRKVVKRQLFVLTFFTLAGLIVVAIGGYTLIGLMLIGAGVGGFIGELALSKFWLPRRSRKIYNQQASLRVAYTYSWDSQGLSVASESAQARRAWSDYIKLMENDHLFLLYHSDIMFEILPKTWFVSDEQIDGFRALASRAGT